MAINLPKYGIMGLYRFPVYESRKDYELRTGKQCPEWDASKAPTYWEDPEAQVDVQVSYEAWVNAEKKEAITGEYVNYPLVMAIDKQTGALLSGCEGRPFMGPLWTGLETARRVNIPPDEVLGDINAGVPVPVPCRELEEGEMLDWLDEERVFAIVRNTAWVETPKLALYTRRDQELLWRIAEKLGVEVAS